MSPVTHSKVSPAIGLLTIPFPVTRYLCLTTVHDSIMSHSWHAISLQIWEQWVNISVTHFHSIRFLVSATNPFYSLCCWRAITASVTLHKRDKSRFLPAHFEIRRTPRFERAFVEDINLFPETFSCFAIRSLSSCFSVIHYDRYRISVSPGASNCSARALHIFKEVEAVE